jgi:serine phosphatase RsbU (regulator of sigma subunit)
LDGESIVVGRSRSADLPVSDGFLSRRHARLFFADDRWHVEDLGSLNGTLLNGSYVTTPRTVAPGDSIEISGSRIEVLGDASAPGTARDESRARPEEPEVSVLGTDLSMSVSVPAASRLCELDRLSAATIQGERELREYSDRLRVLNELHSALAPVLSRDDLLEVALERIAGVFAPEDAAVLLLDEGGEPYWAAWRSRDEQDRDVFYSETLVRQVLGESVAVRVLDAQQDSGFEMAESIQDAGVRSLMAVPLLAGDRTIGLICLSSRLHLRSYSDDDLDLLTSIAAVVAVSLRNLELTEESVQRRWMERDFTLARRIQESLLPASLPEVPGYSLAARNQPSRVVSGDFYQVRERADDFVFLVCDVSGKGLSASLLTAYLEAVAVDPIEKGLAPDEIFSLVNDRLERRTRAESFATAFLACLEPGSGRVTYASAGHNPALVVRRSGSVERHGRTGLPLGLLPGTPYRAEILTLDPGDVLVVYTDGITEAVDPGGEELGLDRLIAACDPTEEAVDMLDGIERALEEFTEGEPYGDDRTVLVLRREAGG